MNRIIAGFVLLFCFGCASLERTTYVTMGATTTAVELARQAYVNHENTCACVSITEHDVVKGYYENYQQTVKLVQDAISVLESTNPQDKSALDNTMFAAATAAADYISEIEKLIPPNEVASLKAKMPKGH